MSRQHFGLTHLPLGKSTKQLWDDGLQFGILKERFEWLLSEPGLGIVTGDPGVGKTAGLRDIVSTLNPHRYQIIYLPETDFGRLDLYRSLAVALGLEPVHRRSQMWRDIKIRLKELIEVKNILPIWIIDEAQNLPKGFFKDLPSFLNFEFDSKDMITIWLVGHPILLHTINRAPYAALSSRVKIRVQVNPIFEKNRFASMVTHAFKESGGEESLISISGMEILRQASQGKPRYVSSILNVAMRLAAQSNQQHLSDDVLEAAIITLK